MGKWLDLGMTWNDTIEHMVEIGIRQGLAEQLLLIEQGKSTGDIEEDERPKGAHERFFNSTQ